MAFHVDPLNGDLVVDGFQNGIGASPQSGIIDMKSVNPATVPGEASVSFSTASQNQTNGYTNIAVTANNATSVSISGLATLQYIENNQAFYVSATTITGMTAGTIYWGSAATSLTNTTQTIAFATAYGSTATLSGLGLTGNATLSTFIQGVPKYFAKSRGNNFMIDHIGQVWSDLQLTTGGTTTPVTNTSSWTYTGNAANSGKVPDTSANGNGLVCYQSVANATGGTGTSPTLDEWVFAFRNSAIDYTQITKAGAVPSPLVTWVQGWNPNTGTTGVANGYLQTGAGIKNPHHALVDPKGGNVTYTDNFFVSSFYQLAPSIPGKNWVGFDPTNSATYFFATYPILPVNDRAYCLAFLNDSLLIGGVLNAIYPWDLRSNHYTAPLILLPESGVYSMVTVGNNAYVFAGNRGNIYITNGSQASIYKKIPDHLSGVVEPLFYWGGSNQLGTVETNLIPTGTATYNKNKLYFGLQAVAQTGGKALAPYGGIWAIDLNTGALWNSNQLSFGSSATPSALMVSTKSSAYGPNIGYGLLAGWTDTATGATLANVGIDASIAAPYTATTATLVSDMIPIGTALNPTTPSQLEFKLASPLISGEAVELLMGSSMADYINNTFTTVGTTKGTGTELSGIFPASVQNQQWLLVKANLVSISSIPSYTRLTQIRVKGGTSKDLIPTQPFSIQ